MPDSTYLEKSTSIADDGLEIGKSPRSVLKSDLQALGHPQSPIKAIRAKCLAKGLRDGRRLIFTRAFWRDVFAGAYR